MRRRLFAVLAFFTAFSTAQALAIECPNNTPRESVLWEQFEDFVEQEYLGGRKFIAANGLVVGHALGRVASAVRGDPDRQAAFACLQLGIEQILGLGVLKDPGGFDAAHQRIIAAAMGMYDEEIRQQTGVSDTSPADQVFAGMDPAGSQAKDAPADSEKGGAKTPDAVADSNAFGVTEPGMNRPGGDYHSFWLDRADPALCAEACVNDTQCLAWTYVNPGVQGDQAKCWLKDVVPDATADGCCTSGVVEDVGIVDGGDSATDASHPWDLVRPDGRWCNRDITDAGYKPIFAMLSAIWETTLVFADPIDNTYVGIAGCSSSAWDWTEFDAAWVEQDTQYPTVDEDPTYFKKVVYRHRETGDWVTIAYFR